MDARTFPRYCQVQAVVKVRTQVPVPATRCGGHPLLAESRFDRAMVAPLRTRGMSFENTSAVAVRWPCLVRLDLYGFCPTADWFLNCFCDWRRRTATTSGSRCITTASAAGESDRCAGAGRRTQPRSLRFAGAALLSAGRSDTTAVLSSFWFARTGLQLPARWLTVAVLRARVSGAWVSAAWRVSGPAATRLRPGVLAVVSYRLGLPVRRLHLP